MQQSHQRQITNKPLNGTDPTATVVTITVFIVSTQSGTARLSWPGIHLTTSRAQQTVTSSIKTISYQ